MQRMFEDVFGMVPWSSESAWAPAVDVQETESEVLVDVEAPGMKPAELDISLTDSTLTVRGEKKGEREEKKGDYQIRERSYGSFVRSVRLPADVDSDNASSKYEDGVLKITLPKSEKSKPKKVAIST
jgi:HSP20 family protein